MTIENRLIKFNSHRCESKCKVVLVNVLFKILSLKGEADKQLCKRLGKFEKWRQLNLPLSFKSTVFEFCNLGC